MSPLSLTLLVSFVATASVVVLGTPIAWTLSMGRPSGWKRFAEALLLLPIVLPPTVVGYGLLLLLGRGTLFGLWLNDFAGIRLLFTWQGAAIASAVMALPLHVRTMIVAFSAIDPCLVEVTKTLGGSQTLIFWRIGLPLAARGMGAGTALAFARAAGEFGATMMVSGAIPQKTQTMPIALYEAVMAGRDSEAALLTLGLVGISAAISGIAFVCGPKRQYSAL